MTTILKIGILAIAGLFIAQDYKNNLQEIFEKEVILKNDQEVSMALNFGNEIKVNSWDKNKLYVKAIVEHNFKEPLEFQLDEENTADEVKIAEKIKNLENEKKQDGRNCIQLNITYEIYMPAKTTLHIKSISGNMEVKNMTGKLNLETISGFVDVAINTSEKYDINCSTISGSIYSDLNFDKNTEIKGDIVGTKLVTSLNGGGKSLKFKSISGDLYLRKK
jgi:hypothetical protein